MIYCTGCYGILLPDEEECPSCFQRTKREFNLDEEIDNFIEEHESFDLDTLIETLVSTSGLDRNEIRRYLER